MGNDRRSSIELLVTLKVVPVLRLQSEERAASAIDCLIEAGYGTVEITLTTPGAVDLIRGLRARVPSGFLIGAGTVLDAQQAHACLDAGADYLVSPALIEELVTMAHERDRAALMGAFTPGEVLAAWRAGADVVKVFPASSGGPGHLAAIHAVYPDIPLCPTGGISAANLLDYLKAGARFVGVGNNVIDQQALNAGNRMQVIEHARSFLELAGSAP
jgi:2-dehydro-3-deoxyphosphogluconate aldolase / (4S)-4-hydroxy-2-oxoglutarate aldolase